MTGVYMGAAVGARSPAVVNPLPGGTAQDHVVLVTAIAGWRFNTNGDVELKEGNGASYAPDHDWFSPNVTAVGDSYWVKATLLSGTSPSGSAVGSWLQLTSQRDWSLSRSAGAGVAQCSLLIQISTDAAGATVVSSGTYDIDIESAS